MKKIIIFASILLIASGISYGQKPIRRNKQEKTEQIQSSSSNQKQQQGTNNKKKTTSSVKVSEPDGYINGHGYVDLGLPSGLKWATCNVGASTPSDYGNYYAWGETQHKSLYSETNSFTTGKNVFELQAENIIDSSGNLSISFDVARANWNGAWRMPTKEEFEELLNKCTWKWINKNGHYGYNVMGPNGKSIFIPAAGDKIEDSLNLWGGTQLEYWSSSPEDSKDSSVILSRISVSGGTGVYIHNSARWFGLPIRPVAY